MKCVRRDFNYTPLAIGAGAFGLILGAGAALRFKRRIKLRNKAVLITGGSRGLGLVMAREFAAGGADVAICARDSEELDRARQELRADGIDVLGILCDITKRTQVERMIQGITRHFGRIDILVNGLTSELNAWVHGLLPDAGGIGTRYARGHESESEWSPSKWTASTDAAAMENNEVAP